MSKLDDAIRYLETMPDDGDVEAGSNEYARKLGAAARREMVLESQWKQRCLNAEEALRQLKGKVSA